MTSQDCDMPKEGALGGITGHWLPLSSYLCFLRRHYMCQAAGHFPSLASSPFCPAQAGAPCGGNHLADGTLVSTVGIFRQPFGFNATRCNLSCGRHCATFLNKGNASQEGKVSVKERERMGLMTQKEPWKKVAHEIQHSRNWTLQQCTEV